MIAAAEGHLSLVEYFLDQDKELANVLDSENRSAPLLALENGHEETVLLLNEKHPPCLWLADDLELTTFDHVAKADNLELFKLLFESWHGDYRRRMKTA